MGSVYQQCHMRYIAVNMLVLQLTIILVISTIQIYSENPCDEPFGSNNPADVCKAYFQRWGFHPVEKVCKDFVYGGCGANGNNFETKEECQEKCEGGTARRKTEM